MDVFGSSTKDLPKYLDLTKGTFPQINTDIESLIQAILKDGYNGSKKSVSLGKNKVVVVAFNSLPRLPPGLTREQLTEIANMCRLSSTRGNIPGKLLEYGLKK